MTGSARFLGVALFSALLSACGGGGKSSTPVTPTPPAPSAQVYVISGVVSGLNGTVVLQVNGGSDVTVTGNGSTTVALTTSLLSGASYTVGVKTQPSSPAQICTATGATGTVGSNAAPITGLTVNCILNTFDFVSSAPATGATKLSCSVAPKLTFSKSIDAATATAANLTLTKGATSQAFTVSVSGAEITITPTNKLTQVASYTLTAGIGLRGTNGEVLSAPAAVTFSCDGAWHAAESAPRPVDSSSENPRIAMDADGNGFAIWSQSDAGLYNVYVRRYTAGSGWSAPEILDQQTDNAYTAVVGFDAAGNAIAAYLGFDGTQNHVFSRRWVSGSGWSAEQRIDALPDDCENPEIAVNAAGNAVVAWYQSDVNDGNWYGVASNYYTAGSGWGTAQILDTITNTNAINPRVAIDAAGNAVAVWNSTGAMRNIWASRYTAGSGWSADELIEQNNSGSAFTPRVKLDASGNGFAVWYQSDGTRTSIWANRFLAASGWGTPQLIETDDVGDAQFPRLDMNAAGDAIVAWQQSDGTRFNVRANRFTPGGGWGTAVTIETDNAGDATFPWVAVGTDGNAIVAWQQSDGTHSNIWANRFATTTGWGTATLLESSDDDADGAVVALDGLGNAMATWQASSDGVTFTTWTNRFDY